MLKKHQYCYKCKHFPICSKYDFELRNVGYNEKCSWYKHEKDQIFKTLFYTFILVVVIVLLM
jgi:hypothetical protein